MSQHTPGPWAAIGGGWIVNHKDERVASVNTDLIGDTANARLIAAAPEMYRALQDAEARLLTLANIAAVGTPMHSHVLKQVRAAIAKAEGRPA
jgi:hypothetical protein